MNAANLANLTDSHCHLSCPQLSKDIPAVLDRARKVGVSRLLTVGQGLDDSSAAIDLAQRNSEVFAAIGFGPHGAEHVSKSDFKKLAGLTPTAKVVALGEVGLDYYYDEPSREVQRKVFSEQVRLAQELDLPLIIHCRDAWDDCLAVLDENRTGKTVGVFHCYTGSSELVPQLIDRGFYISFSGMITFSNARKCMAAAKKVPLDRLLVETDAPYLSPEPMRTVKPNEPSLLVHTVRFMADLLGCTPMELAELSSKNAGKLFGW
ncbi:MAG: YchF/TatD family DNA exonuclease [Actinobacteria bacterium]|nr:YchF/TatD family DNA exonuclease [Actinomycetota bacterium]